MQYKKFQATPVGAKVLAEKHRLADILDNHAYLVTLPQNSLGHHYLNFMAQDHLSVKRLKDITAEAASNLNHASEEIRIFADRTRDLHDLYHVIAGYGRDEIGEICVLAFSYPQRRLRSYTVIAIFGALNLSMRFSQQKLGATGVFNAAFQAYQNGSRAAWLPGQDLEAMLSNDIDLMRQQLKIPSPDKYLPLICRIQAKTKWRMGPIFSGGASH